MFCIKLFCTKQIKATGGNSDDQKLVSHLGEYKRAAVLTPLFAALEAVMDVLLPTIMAFIIDQGIEKGDMNAILKYGLLTFLVAVVALALGVLAGKYAAEASTGLPATCAMPCMRTSSIIRSPTSTSSPPRALSPA